VRAPIGRCLGIRKVERIDFNNHRSAGAKLLDHVIYRGTVELHFVNIDPVQPHQRFGRRFEKRPLIALEVDSACERHGAGGVDALCVQQFNP